jgi:mRNA interferase MazF
MAPLRPRRWDLLLVDLGLGAGNEQPSARPALLVSNDGFNSHFPLATVLPLTKREGKRRRVYGFEVVLPAGAAGNESESIVMPHQIRTIATARIMRRIGTLSDPELRAEIEERIRDHLSLEHEAEPR